MCVTSGRAGCSNGQRSARVILVAVGEAMNISPMDSGLMVNDLRAEAFCTESEDTTSVTEMTTRNKGDTEFENRSRTIAIISIARRW